MAVVINEFEVVDTPQPQARGNGGSDAAPPTATPLAPEDLRKLQLLAAELELRRVAH
jgi:hypothetical protein